MRYFLIALVIMFTMGCVFDSENPLTDPNKEQIDTSLLGTWFWVDEKEHGFIHIGLNEKSHLLRVLMVDFDKDRELEASEFIGHTSLLEGKKYLNLKWVYPPQKDVSGYIFVKYTVSSDSLGIALIDSDAAEKAIKNGALIGRLKTDKWSYPVHVTEGQKKLRDFIIRNDKELFPEMKYLQKLELPKKSPKRTGKPTA